VHPLDAEAGAIFPPFQKKKNFFNYAVAEVVWGLLGACLGAITFPTSL
jgi:hypothetical protein